MKCAVSIFCMAILLAGCTKMADYYDGEVLTDVDGEEFIVVKRSEGNYLASPNNADHFNVWTLDARVGPMNVTAIEKVTGCKVPLASVQNHGISTFATVDCK